MKCVENFLFQGIFTIHVHYENITCETLPINNRIFCLVLIGLKLFLFPFLEGLQFFFEFTVL